MIFLRKCRYQYDPDRQIGTGAYGVCFQGFLIKGSNKKVEVAIKQYRNLDKGHRVPNPRLEIEILKELSQVQDAENVIAKYIDDFFEDDHHYLVMEYCKYGSIYDYLIQKKKRVPFNEYQVREIVFQILAALDIIHNASFIHRDLSPKNILIHSFSDDSVPKIRLIDFGLSKKIEMVNGTVAGTPGFFNKKMMRDKYTKEVDFYALGCVTFFMLTADLLSTQHNYVPNKTVIENRLRPYKVSQDALEFIMFLITSDRIDNVKAVQMENFIMHDVMEAAKLQASVIRSSIERQQTTTMRDIQNRPHRNEKLPTQAQSLPMNLVPKPRTDLSVATSVSPALWPMSSDLLPIVKNVMVNNFGRAILRGPENLLICETLDFRSNKCTYVGRLVNACKINQQLIMYRPSEREDIRFSSFEIFPDGVPVNKLELLREISGQRDLEGCNMSRSMYSKMRSILKAVCALVRKREENPNMLVDTVAKMTWGGMISVELPGKKTIHWRYDANGPPLREASGLPREVQQMLLDVHEEFGRSFGRRKRVDENGRHY